MGEFERYLKDRHAIDNKEGDEFTVTKQAWNVSLCCYGIFLAPRWQVEAGRQAGTKGNAVEAGKGWPCT